MDWLWFLEFRSKGDSMPAITYRGSHTLDCTVLDVRKQWRTLGARATFGRRPAA